MRSRRAVAGSLSLALVVACGSSSEPVVGAGSGSGTAAVAVVTDAGAPPPSGAQDAGCVCPPGPQPDDDAATAALHDKLTLLPRTFADLPDWAEDHLAEAVPSFLASCAKLTTMPGDKPIGVDAYSGRARDWRRACEAAARVPAGDDAKARAFFEREFTPYEARNTKGPDGKMTAYNVQPLRGSKTKHGPYQFPLYKRPRDLVQVNLSAFIKDGRGRSIWGKVDRDGDFVPYASREEIRKGALAGQHLELMYADDPVDALYAQIEGSAKAVLDDGTTEWVEFDGKNGRGYRGVGKILRESGELAKGQGTMQGIRAWFEAHPDRRDEIMDQDTSFVFFKFSSRPGAVGSQGVILTPRRSAAVDRAFVAHSTPLWIDSRAPVVGGTGTAPWRHLVIAQDTGGGIVGPVRADLYWGDDQASIDVAGRMGGPGRYWLLLPRGLPVPVAPPATDPPAQPSP
ncbi:MAG: murein transglycosylase A [Deltaproteobacteria bacterium]|nr:murein transglycosylase A [Deltaproteobacteria bacterium]